eukprot:1885920-Rhodomonas_salina.2
MMHHIPVTDAHVVILALIGNWRYAFGHIFNTPGTRYPVSALADSCHQWHHGTRVMKYFCICKKTIQYPGRNSYPGTSIPIPGNDRELCA